MQNNEEFENNENKIEFQTKNEETELTSEEKNIIEIPKEYYDKLDQERREKDRLEKEVEEKKLLEKKENASSVRIIGNTLVNMIIIFLSLYSTLNLNRYCIFILPIYIVVVSIYFAIKEKKKSNFPVEFLLGGIILAIISFLVATTSKENGELWMYYTIASIITGFVGLIIANVITWVIAEHKNIKALQTLGVFILFAILIGTPIYLYKKYPEEFIKIVFREQPEVKAETEIEFIEKTLKYRYGIVFTCKNGKNYLDEKKQKVTIRTCTTEEGIETSVTSTAYDESNVLYTVTDDYLSVLYLNNFKKSLEKELGAVTNASITVRLYPETKCSFVGDCVECDEYNAYEKEEKDKDNLYKNSSKLNLEKYKTMKNATEFVNEYKFKYIIKVVGQYGGLMSDRYEEITESIIDHLNSKGLKNTYGYEIVLRNSNELNKIVYKVKGITNDEKTFKDPILDELK